MITPTPTHIAICTTKSSAGSSRYHFFLTSTQETPRPQGHYRQLKVVKKVRIPNSFREELTRYASVTDARTNEVGRILFSHKNVHNGVGYTIDYVPKDGLNAKNRF